MIPTSTPESDAMQRIQFDGRTCIVSAPEDIEDLERQRDTALASLASAQAALRDINAEAVSERVWTRVMNLSASALADNCAAPWFARFVRRTKALDKITHAQNLFGAQLIAREALEDQ